MIQTQRLLLREPELKDISNIHQLLSLPETDEFNTMGIPESIHVTEKLVQEWLQEKNNNPRNKYIFVMELINDGKFIGLIALNMGKLNYKTAEVWFKIHKYFFRKGYTTEALNRVLEFGFTDLQLHRIEAGCAVENIGSIKVLEKAGMIREGMKRKKLPIRGELKDNYFYGILEDEFNYLKK